MHQLAKAKSELAALAALNTITSLYQEMAIFKMNQIREMVLDTRLFLEGVATVYQKAKKSYLLYLKRQRKRLKKGEEIFFISRNKKTIVVFLSTNEHFYGGLIFDIWKNVLSFLQKNPADLLVLGKIGRQLAESLNPPIPFRYLKLDDEKNISSEIEAIINAVKHYEKIVVFHGKFITPLFQTPVMNDISGGTIGKTKETEVRDYLFEPSPREVLQFFETEIISALFNHTILEHRLAKYAARMVAMYKANENIKIERGKLEKTQKRLIYQLLDRKQLEIFSGFNLWK